MSKKLNLKNIPSKDRTFVRNSFKSISKQLKSRRLELDISQELLAEKLDLSVGTIKGIEQNIRTASLPNLFRIARVLKLKIILESR